MEDDEATGERRPAERGRPTSRRNRQGGPQVRERLDDELGATVGRSSPVREPAV